VLWPFFYTLKSRKKFVDAHLLCGKYPIGAACGKTPIAFEPSSHFEKY
jgi:hypothetical protein